jgi:hypothetical protein
MEVEGDFSSLSQWLGTDLDYNKIKTCFWAKLLMI